MRKEYGIDVSGPADSYLLGHRVNGQCVLPVSAFVYFAWKTLATSMSIRSVEELAVKLTDVVCHRLVRLAPKTAVRLTVALDCESGGFEVRVNGTELCCTGQIRVVYEQQRAQSFQGFPDTLASFKQSVTKVDAYQMLKQRGHELSGPFQCILNLSCDGKGGEIEWNNGRWIELLDGILILLIY